MTDQTIKASEVERANQLVRKLKTIRLMQKKGQRHHYFELVAVNLADHQTTLKIADDIADEWIEAYADQVCSELNNMGVEVDL